MNINNNIGLVLEGGGMRGVFTCGVLDALMEAGRWFNYVVGVSAGAGNGASYLSRQIGRAKVSNIELMDKYHYVGLHHLLKKGCIFDPDLLYDKFPKEIYPFDFDTYRDNPAVFEIVTTNCQTGRAEYLTEKNDHERLLRLLRASGSLPYVSRIVEVDGQPMLDGGLTDSIPIERAMALGHEKNVVVLTRNKGYRKKDNGWKVPPFIYSQYPRLRLALSSRAKLYNSQLDLIDKLESEGKIIVIRPQKPIEVDRLERDTRKLLRLYNEGYEMTKEKIMQKEI
ncbi:MAG: patatin family protein [Bacteroidaceae bacterium]|nr:patatin family protein [Bacteroidaceae bacterium]